MCCQSNKGRKRWQVSVISGGVPASQKSNMLTKIVPEDMLAGWEQSMCPISALSAADGMWVDLTNPNVKVWQRKHGTADFKATSLTRMAFSFYL
jgi:hypothetical protein